MSDLKNLLANTVFKKSTPSNPGRPSKAQDLTLLNPTERQQKTEQLAKQIASFDSFLPSGPKESKSSSSKPQK